MLRHLDLFSGIGGFALACSWAGFKTVGFSEIDPFCEKVLCKHWGNVPNYGSVRNIHKIPDLDLITGGFPCQPFSVAGKQKGRNDDRHLWPEFRRIIELNRPAFVVAENVTGIIAMELDNIIDDLEAIGYETQTYIIPACAVGAPHQRKRIWIVAHAMRDQCDSGIDSESGSKIESNWKRDVTAVQAEWAGLFPKSWKTFTFQKWIGSISDTSNQPNIQTDSSVIAQRSEWESRHINSCQCGTTSAIDDWQKDESGISRMDDGVSAWLDRDLIPLPGVENGLPNIINRNKSLGNAIVPQVIYPILRAIALILKQQRQ